MYKIMFILLLHAPVIFSQSKSITRFRSDYKESSNLFFYSSTLKMLNPEGNPDFDEILKDVEKVRILNYTKQEQEFDRDDIAKLKKNMQDEGYISLMMIREEGNSIELFNRERKKRTIGFVAVVENDRTLVLIDLTGSIDIKKFLELKQKIDAM